MGNDVRRPYRVAIWGPGALGKALVRECMAKPEIELVGALGYNPELAGMDVGEKHGLGTAGVTITTDKEEILRLKPDCVLHATNVTKSRGVDKAAVEDDVCRLLEHGINVVTSAVFHYPSAESQKLDDRIEAACRAGGSVIHSTGINPGLLNERWVLGLTCACTKIHSIKVQEISNLSSLKSRDMLVDRIGIGDVPANRPIGTGSYYYYETIRLTCHLMGLTVDRIDFEKEYLLADRRFESPLVTVEPGTIAGNIARYTGFVDGKPFFVLEELFFMYHELCPVDLRGENNVNTIRIEGEPTSIDLTMALKSSVLEDRWIRKDGTRPTYNATSAAMIQAIPLVCGAQPGILYPHAFTNFVPDLRDFRSPLIVR
jgi:4-hydroxy-tetrahydrodipicolinate reductase